MERGSDSDGEDAMAYFLPNGIADDSPPKRSALAAPPSFGPIGGRFGGVYGASAPPPAPGARDLSTPLFGGLGGPGAAASSPAPARPSFLLSDLGGEILEPPATDAPGGKAIGGGRNPFAFSGAFASLAAESDSMGRPASNSIDFVDDPRGDFVGTPKASASGFRSDAEIFPPASSGGMGAVYGRATLNANAPAFMASSAHDSAPYGSSSPSAWPTMNVKPRRAPPGLSKPTEDVSLRGEQAGDGGGPLSLPPGLARPSQMSSFSGFASTSASLFSGEGVRHFASKLQPSLTSLSDAFRSGGATRERDFQSPLSELNAKSLSVEEVQSNLKATAIAAAQDVVSEAPVQKAQREITPRSGAKRSIEFKSPPGIDEKRGVDINNRVGTEPRSRTSSRRNEATGTVIAASPTAIPRSDRRGRNAKEPVAVEATRQSRQPAVESTSRSGRRARGGQNHNVPSGETKSTEGPAATAPESSSRSHEPSSRKKPPSSVSSAGSDDQLLTVSTLVEPVSEARIGPGPAKIKESPRETKASNRGGTKKSIVPLVNDKRGVPKRQIYREKIPVAEPLKEQKDEAVQSNKPEDGDQARLGADACVIDGAVSETPERESIMAVPQTDVSEREEKSTQSQDPIVMDVEENEETPLEIQSMPCSQSDDSPAPPSPAPTEEQDTIGDGAESADTSSFVPTDEDKPSGSEPTLEPSGATAVTQTPPSYIESDSGSEIPEVVLRAVRAGPSSDRKTSTKKDKHKKEKVEKKKSVSSAKSNKKEKRDSSSSGKGDLADDEPFSTPAPKKPSMPTTVKVSGLLRDARFLLRRSVAAVWSAFWFLCVEFADRVNLKGFLGWSFSYLESFLAVVFSVILLLSLHGASFFIRLHRVAFRAVLTHRHVGFCFAFLYAFPYLVQYVFPWAPPWAPVCLWYAFLVQLFCTSGPTAMVATFRVVLPLVFLIEGISHHSFLLDLNGAELLLASFILSAMKTSNLCSPIFLLSLAVQCLSAVFLGSELVVQWFQLTLALYSLHAMAASDEDWAGLGDEDEDVSCRPISMHHSIADYNYHPAPSAPSIQKTKRLDRRALAYVRGRKFR